MNNEELKQAFINKIPVMHRGIRYKQINAIIYRFIKGELTVSAELQSNVANSITIARANEVSIVET